MSTSQETAIRNRTSPRRATRRTRACAVLAVVVVVLLPSAAAAVGAQGVDLQVLLPERAGVPTGLVADDGQPIDLRLTNTAQQARTASVFASVVERADDGTPSLGAAAGWITVAGGQDVVVDPGESLDLVATVDLAGYRAAATEDLAFVVAIDGGGNVVTQAAAIIRLTDGGAQLPVPVGLLVLATALLALVGSAWLRVVRRQGVAPRSTLGDRLDRQVEQAHP